METAKHHYIYMAVHSRSSVGGCEAEQEGASTGTRINVVEPKLQVEQLNKKLRDMEMFDSVELVGYILKSLTLLGHYKSAIQSHRDGGEGLRVVGHSFSL